MAEKRQFGNRPQREQSEFDERVVEIARVSRVVKGGRRMRFRVLVVIGDRKGKIGYGIAKAAEISVGVKKAVTQAKKRMILVPVVNDTIPYEVTISDGSAKIILKPAGAGTSIVAGGVIRIVAELAGIKNLLSKVMGSANKVNNVKAVLKAFSSFDSAKVEIMKSRSENIREIKGNKGEKPGEKSKGEKNEIT
ncbi:MAG: 30S ribosomal protein S5 [Candidatus Berkelbacteria bacterium]|nr:30S ribosomal protein S5 [Candidatus Berkelbacteria bacterium]